MGTVGKSEISARGVTDAKEGGELDVQDKYNWSLVHYAPHGQL